MIHNYKSLIMNHCVESSLKKFKFTLENTSFVQRLRSTLEQERRQEFTSF